MSFKEQKEPTPFKSAAQKRYKKLRKKNDIYSRPSGHKNLSTGKPFDIKAKQAGTDRLRFEDAEPELPFWDMTDAERYEPTADELHKDWNLYLEQEREAEPQYELNARVKIKKAETTKGEVLAQIRGITGVTIVDSHGDPRARYFKKPEDPDYIFAMITIRFYPVWPLIGKMQKSSYVRDKLFPSISAIAGVAAGIGAHGGIKLTSAVRGI